MYVRERGAAEALKKSAAVGANTPVTPAPVARVLHQFAVSFQRSL